MMSKGINKFTTFFKKYVTHLKIYVYSAKY
jgi:hypothetical protein